MLLLLHNPRHPKAYLVCELLQPLQQHRQLKAPCSLTPHSSIKRSVLLQIPLILWPGLALH
jgi:hypothetical protein